MLSGMAGAVAEGPSMDFSANPDAVAAVAEAHRLAYGHLFNSAFAAETSLIDPLPLFRLPFRIVSGEDARAGNPFLGPESDQVIVSIDTLAGERMFGHLKDSQIDA